jgi:hypothetical protein
MQRFPIALAACLAAVALVVGVAAATPAGGDTQITSGSPPTPFPQNKQNEPAVAVNPVDPSIVAAGANDELDLEACNNRSDTTCPFTSGIGTSGIYFSDNGGSTWTQPTYTGLTSRDCLGVVGTDPGNPADNCDPHTGPIGTLPNYAENGLVSDGDPAVAFGPQRGPDGSFSWSEGWRLYYANITSNLSSERSEVAFKGFEAVGVSRLDSQDYGAAKAGDNAAWKAPVIVTKQNAALFSDHEMIAVDDAESSPFFGNVYICSAAFRSQEIGGLPSPIVLSSSSDGGDSWRTRQVSPAVNNNTIPGRQDCAVNTDSKGTVYVLWDGFDQKTKSLSVFMIRSSDGGKTFSRPARIVTGIDQTGIVDPESGDLTFDGATGARDGSFPTVDIANGAPTGAGATDEVVLAWSNGPTPSDTQPGANEQLRVMWSRDGGASWSSGAVASPATDRPDFPAVAISPDGRDAYVTYLDFLQPWQSTTASPRLFQGVVRHADVDPATGSIGAWSDLYRAPVGDARGSSANALTDEFLGDYNYAFATNDSVVAAWNDARNAADCPAIDAYRQKILDGTATSASDDPSRPAPATDCPATFGNTDIWGGSFADPTP